jgi:cullin-4
MLPQRVEAGKPGGGAAGGGRKLVIKPLKSAPKLPQDFEQNTWGKLVAAVHAVHNKQAVAHSLEELYRAVQDMCLNGMASTVYDRLQTECERHIEGRLNALLGQTPDTLAFLNLVHGTWDDHCEQMHTLRSIFLYLDRTYVMQAVSKKSLWEMGLQIFHRHLQQRAEVTRKTVQGLLTLIESERNGDQVARSLLHALLRMFHDLSIYPQQFEVQFIEATTRYYEAEAAAQLQARDVPSYLLHVKARLQQEEQRVQHYLHMATRKPLLQTALQMLLAAHTDAILEKGFTQLMDQNRVDDLTRMYALYAQVDALPQLRQALSSYIKRVGTAMVSDRERDRVLVQELLQLKEKLDRILAHAFAGNEQFGHTLKEAFECFINVRQSRPAELIAKFLDAKLRAGNKGTSEEELEEVLDKTMTLFRFIDGKDMFEAFYKKDLSKRLLLGKSASIDAEKSMISKLKAECGSGFTCKLEGMFKDVDLSRDVMASFRESPQARAASSSDIELSVHVLTQGYWPTYPPAEVTLPGDILELQKQFSSYYMSKHNGRRLQWHPYLGHCTLKANFPLGRKELAVSLLQTVVLLQFNDFDDISYHDILKATGIEEKELKVTLQSLACGKVRVLRKEPKGREVDEADVFSFESGFKQQLFRIKVNSIQMRETEQENEQTTERVFQDRQYQIDAAIVRIMKARKSLSHSLLISELFQQLKFPLKPPDLKKRIESLIDREYLERESNSSYRYLA